RGARVRGLAVPLGPAGHAQLPGPGELPLPARRRRSGEFAAGHRDLHPDLGAGLARDRAGPGHAAGAGPAGLGGGARDRVAPVVLAFVVSLFRWDLLGTRSFLGLENYRSLLADGALANSLLVTGIFTLISVPVSLAIGLVLATQLVRALPGSAVVRVIVVIPWVCAPLALGVVWKWIFQPSVGALNQILGVRIEWL